MLKTKNPTPNVPMTASQAAIVQRLLLAELHATAVQIKTHGKNPSVDAHQRDVAALKVSTELVIKEYGKQKPTN